MSFNGTSVADHGEILGWLRQLRGPVRVAYEDGPTGLGCLRGISALTGLALTVEIGDWTRFTGASIGAYVGLVPREYSSGASRVQGSITKAGNAHVRRFLVEAAWASPAVLSQPLADDAGPVGQSRPGLKGPRTRRESQAAPAVVPITRAQEEPIGGRRGHRARAGRLVLVAGDPELTATQHRLDRSQPFDGEVCELDLRYSYEPQRDSRNLSATPVPREQPTFTPNHRLAVPNPRISDTTVVDQRPPRHRLTPIKRKPPRHQPGRLSPVY